MACRTMRVATASTLRHDGANTKPSTRRRERLMSRLSAVVSAVILPNDRPYRVIRLPPKPDNSAKAIGTRPIGMPGSQSIDPGKIELPPQIHARGSQFSQSEFRRFRAGVRRFHALDIELAEQTLHVIADHELVSRQRRLVDIGVHKLRLLDLLHGKRPQKPGYQDAMAKGSFVVRVVAL
jgi:hypothetical protein